jgi:hypothetical protein
LSHFLREIAAEICAAKALRGPREWPLPSSCPVTESGFSALEKQPWVRETKETKERAAYVSTKHPPCVAVSSVAKRERKLG